MRWDLNSSLTFAKSLANQDDIKINISSRGDATFRPYSHNGTIHLSAPSPENLDVYEPELHRCISHNFKEVAFTQSQQYEEGSRSEATHRLLTDYIAERAKLGEYEGRDEILSNHRSRIMDGFDTSSIGDDKLEQLMHTLTRARNDWQSYVHDDELSTLERNGFIPKLNHCSTEEELRELVQLVETVEQEQEDQQEGGNDEEGEGGKDRGGDNEDGQGDQPGDSSIKDEGGAEEHGVGFNASEALESANILGQSTKMEVEYDWDSHEYIPRDAQEFSREVVPNMEVRQPEVAELNRLLDTLKLSKKVKRHLLSMRQSGYEYGLKKGRLNNKAISRVYTNRGGGIPSIFKQKNSSRLEIETAVSILCDCSGSMSGTKFRYASASCIATSLILQDLKINHEIIGFSTSQSMNLYHQFRRYGETLVSREVLVKRFLSYNVSMGCNSDGEALTYCMEHLLHRKERSKVLLVLSDGQPAGNGYGDSGMYLRKVCKSIEEDGRVNLAAIGIFTQCVEDYYSNFQTINDAEDLEPAILQVMSKNIIR